MEISVCDHCYARDNTKLTPAVIIVPEIFVPAAHEKIPSRALCVPCYDELKQAFLPIPFAPKHRSELPVIPEGTPGYVGSKEIARRASMTSGQVGYYLSQGLKGKNNLVPVGRRGLYYLYKESDVAEFIEQYQRNKGGSKASKSRPKKK